MVKQITLKKLVALACLSFFSLSSWAYELVIPEGTTEITMEDGYAGDKDITSVVIPNSVSVIGELAFYGCSSLKEIIGLDAVDKIGFFAFYDCDNLNQVLYYNHGKKCLGWLGAEGPHELTIPDGVESIDNGAFSGCAWLTSITIPNSVTTIGETAFEGCTGLTSIAIPNSVTEIGYHAFYECEALDTVVMSMGKYEENLYLPSFKTLVFTGSLVEWLSDDREDMISLVDKWDDVNDVRVHGSVIVDGKNLRDLTSVTIPSGVTSIGGSAFEGCTSLTSVVIPNSVTVIKEEAFADCSNLTSVTIPSGVTSIGGSAFEGCTSLTSVVIPNSVTVIGEDAFYGCKSLTSIVIPASVKEISWEAFNGCTNLKKVTCLAKVPPMAEDEDGYDTFGNYNAYLYIPCDNLEDYDLHQVWGKFKYIKCLEANTVEDHPVTDVVVTPSSQEAAFEWPTTDNAATYTLTIQKDGEVFCTLVFNANGQLTTIDFSSLRSGSDGFSFNVTGLREDSEYSYLMEVKDKSQKVLNSYSGAFKTLKEGDYVENISIDEMPITIEDGVIVVDAKKDDNVSIYNMQGQCLVNQTGSVSFQVPSEGVYVVECGNKAVKVIVK